MNIKSLWHWIFGQSLIYQMVVLVKMTIISVAEKGLYLVGSNVDRDEILHSVVSNILLTSCLRNTADNG